MSAARAESPNRDAVVALACAEGISFQAALRRIDAGDTEGGRGTPQHTKLISAARGARLPRSGVKSAPAAAASAVAAYPDMIGTAASSPPPVKPPPRAAACPVAEPFPSRAVSLGARGGTGGADDSSSAVPPPAVSVPQMPPPPARPEAPSLTRAAELAAMDAWLAANPVRRSVDWGDLSEDVDLLRRHGLAVAKAPRPVPDTGGPTIYLIGGQKLRGTPALRAYAAKVRAGKMPWQRGGS